MSLKKSRFSTRLTHSGRHPFEHFGAVNPPVYHASTILAPSMQERRRRRTEPASENAPKTYSYGRRGTPTSAAFEEAVAHIYAADGAVAVSSGLAAIACALQAVVKSGDHILVADTVYRPTRNYCDGYLAAMGVTTTYYNPRLGAETRRPPGGLAWRK